MILHLSHIFLTDGRTFIVPSCKVITAFRRAFRLFGSVFGANSVNFCKKFTKISFKRLKRRGKFTDLAFKTP